MRVAQSCAHILSWFLIIATAPLYGSAKLHVRNGRPVVDGLYVNGHGPYRFLVDTGANVNLIDAGLARKIGLATTLQVDLASAAGKTSTTGSDGNTIVLDTAAADQQRFLFSDLAALHASMPDVQGVLGEWFLARFDYRLDLRGRQIDFAPQQPTGMRAPFRMINARPIVSTSLGDLALDSGQDRMVLFGISPGSDSSPVYELHTITGVQRAARVSGRSLLIGKRSFATGDALGFADRPEPGIDGLLPLSLFNAIYISNSHGYIVVE